MKLKLLLITVFSAICLNTMAQQEIIFDDLAKKESKVATRIGFVAGFNMSSISDNASQISSGLGMRPGFNAGIAANFRFLKRNERSSCSQTGK